MNQRQQLIEQIRQQSIQKRAQALREAAQKQVNNAPIANAAAGASSSGGGRAASCDPEAGISFYISGGPGTSVVIRHDFMGFDENDRPQYSNAVVPGLFVSSIVYDSAVSKWKLTVSVGGTENYSYSDSLISSTWTPLTGGLFTPLYTECGQPDLGDWCIGIPDLGFGPLQAQAIPGWLDQPTTEKPNLWSFAFGSYLWIDGLGWLVELDGVGEVGIPGGSQDVLPPLADIVTGITLTATAGSCGF